MQQNTHARVLLDALQDVLGWDQEVNEVAQAVPTVCLFHHVEDLAQNRGRRGLKGRVECRERALDTVIQGLGILPRERGNVKRCIHWLLGRQPGTGWHW